jgi:hypothetical protein
MPSPAPEPRTPTALDLRAAADALDRRDRIQAWKTVDLSSAKIVVRWNTGSLVPGYDDISKEFAAILDDQANAFRDQAIARIEMDCDMKLQAAGIKI